MDVVLVGCKVPPGRFCLSQLVVSARREFGRDGRMLDLDRVFGVEIVRENCRKD